MSIQNHILDFDYLDNQPELYVTGNGCWIHKGLFPSIIKFLLRLTILPNAKVRIKNPMH